MPRPKAPVRSAKELWQLAIAQCEKDFQEVYAQPWNPEWGPLIRREHERVTKEEARAEAVARCLGQGDR